MDQTKAQGVNSRAGPSPGYLDPARGPNHTDMGGIPGTWCRLYYAQNGPDQGTQRNMDHVRIVDMYTKS